MCKSYVGFVIVLNLNVLCCGQVVLFGDCGNVTSMEYFEIERFLGKWYTIQRFPSWYEEYGQCAYKLVQQCGRSIEFQHRSIRNGIEYILHINTTYAPGDAAVFAIPKNNIGQRPLIEEEFIASTPTRLECKLDPFGIPLSIIRTDYTDYAIVYGCKYNQPLKIKYVLAWILSRNTTLSPEILDNAYKELNALPGISTVYMETVSYTQELCSYQWTAHVQAIYYNNTDVDP